MRLADRVVLVTGASRGIGRGIAEVLAEEGAHVAVNYVTNADRAEEVEFGYVRGLGRRAVSVQADVASRKQVELMVRQVTEELGPIDVLVNNAGVESIIPFLDLDDAEWQRITDVNLKGEWLCSQVVVREWVTTGRRGNIVNIGSVQAGVALPGRTHYAPTKRGVEALTRNLAAELAVYGIRVNCVHPGLFDTDMTQWVMADDQVRPIVLDKIALHRAAQPRELGPAVVFFASDDSSYVTGQCLYVDGGMELL